MNDVCPLRVATALPLAGDLTTPELLDRLSSFKKERRNRWPDLLGPKGDDGIQAITCRSTSPSHMRPKTSPPWSGCQREVGRPVTLGYRLTTDTALCADTGAAAQRWCSALLHANELSFTCFDIRLLPCGDLVPLDFCVRLGGDCIPLLVRHAGQSRNPYAAALDAGFTGDSSRMVSTQGGRTVQWDVTWQESPLHFREVENVPRFGQVVNPSHCMSNGYFGTAFIVWSWIDNSIQHATRVWSRYKPRPVTSDDTVEMILHVGELYEAMRLSSPNAGKIAAMKKK